MPSLMYQRLSERELLSSARVVGLSDVFVPATRKTGRKRTGDGLEHFAAVTPLTPALPVEGRGRSAARSRAAPASFQPTISPASPSPLNGERAGVRGVTSQDFPIPSPCFLNPPWFCGF